MGVVHKLGELERRYYAALVANHLNWLSGKHELNEEQLSFFDEHNIFREYSYFEEVKITDKIYEKIVDGNYQENLKN